MRTALALGIAFGLVAVGSQSAQAQTLTTLASFNGINGTEPESSLTQGTDGNFYGTTAGGGANNNCNPGCGTVFKITPTGVLTTLYSFCSQTNCGDGAVPQAGLVQATDGNFYGTTAGGGQQSAGTIFKITPGGMLTTLYRFCSLASCIDGAGPQAGLVQGTDGNFYGTTAGGGANSNCGGGCGTVFRLTPSGALTTLYSFCPQGFTCADGNFPEALVQATDGNFYGTTYSGGLAGTCGGDGCGTVFKITPGGTLTTLYSFCTQSGCGDGEQPLAGLVQGTDGNFYGTTPHGGNFGVGCGSIGCGTVFKITPTGVLTTLYSFCSQTNCSDGRGPQAGLVQGTDGNLYGTTAGGGQQDTGTIFKITPGGEC